MKRSLDLDGIYDASETAQWLGISRRTLVEKANAGIIPALPMGRKSLRFHPRTILDALHPKSYAKR